MQNRQNTLVIDTTRSGLAVVKLQTAKSELILESKQQLGSQALLGLIKQAFKKGGIKPEALNQIQVITGPGSFTGIRIGLAVANALGFALNIPVNGKAIETTAIYA